MRSKKLSAVFFGALFMLTVLVAGCGGGEQSGGESQNNSPGKTQGGKSEGGGKTGLETRTVIGRVADVRPEGRRLVVRTSAGGQDTPQRLVFLVARNAKVTLDGKGAALADAEKGQQVQVNYFVKNDLERALEVALFGQGEAAPASGGTTG